jgi:hypothetical protein
MFFGLVSQHVTFQAAYVTGIYLTLANCTFLRGIHNYFISFNIIKKDDSATGYRIQ